MYRYHGIIRAFAGSGLASTSVYVYSNAAGSTLASIYNAGGSGIGNPTTTSDRGAIDVYSPRAALWYKVSGDTVVQPLPRHGAEITFNVMDYGATGDGATNDTAAFQAAFDAIEALGVSGGLGEPYGRPGLYIPAGLYVVDGFEINFRNLVIKGAGSKNTQIKLTGATPFLTFGTYDSTPAGAHIGEAQGSNLSGFEITTTGTWGYASLDSQTRVGIRDNGSGWMRLEDVHFLGLKYGLYAPYGHDYCWYYDCDFTCCLIAAYYGPGSQQINHFGTSFAINDQSMVIEHAFQGNLWGCTFNEPRARDLNFGSPDTLHSGAATTNLPLAKELNWQVNGCWFETGAGWGAGWAPTEHILVGDHDETNVVRGIHIYNTCLVSGTTGMGEHAGGVVYAFLNADKGHDIDIDRIQVSGTYIEAIVTGATSSNPRISVKDYNLMDGFEPGPAIFDPWEAGETQFHQWRETSGTYPSTTQSGSGAVVVAEARGNTGAGSRLWHSGYMCMSLSEREPSGSTWYERVKFDLSTYRLYLGDVGSSESSIQWGNAAPTSGAYRVGDVIFNRTVAPSGFVGWVCTTAGTGGDGAVFKTFGAVSA